MQYLRMLQENTVLVSILMDLQEKIVSTRVCTKKCILTSFHLTRQHVIIYPLLFIIGLSATGSSTTGSGTHMITNGFCSFSPTSKKGKWIFMMQTVILSFTPIVILLAQNGMSFYSLMLEKQGILHKNELVIFTLFIKLN